MTLIFIISGSLKVTLTKSGEKLLIPKFISVNHTFTFLILKYWSSIFTLDIIAFILGAKYFNIDAKDIAGAKRSADIVFPRQIAMYIARNYIKESLPKIGSDFGGKDHTTVMYSVKKIEEEVKTNSSLAEEIEKIVEKLNVEKL